MSIINYNNKIRTMFFDKRLLPVKPKVKYDNKLDATLEYARNYDTLYDFANSCIRLNPSDYDVSEFGDDPENGMLLFPDIAMGYGYTANVGKYLPDPKSEYEPHFYKHFRIRKYKECFTVGTFRPEYGEGSGMAVFSDNLLDTLKNVLNLPMSIFFTFSTLTGLQTFRNDETRWLFHGGLVSGKIEARNFYYFNKFTDQLQFPNRLVDDYELAFLKAEMWNVAI